jgi:hypothetical protein
MQAHHLLPLLFPHHRYFNNSRHAYVVTAIILKKSIKCKIGRSMAQAVSRRPLTAKSPVQSHASPYGICGAQNGTGTGFPPGYSCVPRARITPQMIHTHSLTYHWRYKISAIGTVLTQNTKNHMKLCHGKVTFTL